MAAALHQPAAITAAGPEAYNLLLSLANYEDEEQEEVGNMMDSEAVLGGCEVCVCVFVFVRGGAACRPARYRKPLPQPGWSGWDT